MPGLTRYILPLALVLFAAMPRPLVALTQTPASCTPSGQLTQLEELPEASGLAISRRVPGRLWTHNDSGRPVLFALDHRGAVSGQLQITGATVEDWEAIAVGPCSSGSCIYLGDIGDNQARRRRITIYRISEPENASGTASVSGVFHATYPDGAHDAETLLAGPDGQLFVVTKGETGPVAIYRFPADLQTGQTVKLERLGASQAAPDASARITDGSVSPDGQWVALRSRATLTRYRAADLFEGHWRAASTVNLTALKEPQGEGVALGGDGSVFLAGEGGGNRRAGTFVRFSCTAERH